MNDTWKNKDLDELYEEFEQEHGTIDRTALIDYLIREYISKIKEQTKNNQ